MADVGNEFEDYTEDFGHQACYIFKPSASIDHEIDDRPKKKRKTAKDAPSTIDAWPRLYGGAEPLELANLRQKTFRSLWSEHEERIEQIVNKVDDNVLRDVDDFIQSDDDSAGRLKTGLIVSGPDSHGQKYLLDHLKERQASSPSSVLIQLYASQAPNLQTALKNIIRTAIETHSNQDAYTSFLASHKRLLPLNFDLELLQEYISQNKIQKIIISIPDAETFDTSILSELLSSLSSWTNRTPFITLLGIATTIDLFESRLSKSTIRLLSAATFDLTSNQERKIYQMFCAMQCSPRPGPYLGPSTVNTLLELTQAQTNTTSTFTRALNYTYMSHFFANLLSLLLAPDIPDSSDISPLCEAIRNTPSFQTYCSALLKLGKSRIETVRQLLNNDAFLISQSQTAVKLGAANVRRVNEQIQVIVTLYKYLIPSRESPLALHLQVQQSLSSSATLVDTDIYLTLTGTLTALASHDLLALISTYPDIFFTVNPSGGTSQMSRSISKLQNKNSVASIQSSHSISHSTSASRSKSMSNSTSTEAETEYTAILDSLTTSLDTYLSSTSLSPSDNNSDTTSSLFLSEAFIHNARSPLHPTLLPRPRFALERALRVPSDYLGCECCVDPSEHHTQQSSGSVRVPAAAKKMGREASSILFNLLDEAGREVNVRDLWDAFLNVMLPAIITTGTETADANADAESQVEALSAEDLPHKNKTKSKPKAKAKGKAASKPNPRKSDTNGTSSLPNPPETNQQDVDGHVDVEEEEEEPDQDKETHILALFYTALAELKMLGLIKPSSSSSTSYGGASNSTSQRGKGIDVISRTVWSSL